MLISLYVEDHLLLAESMMCIDNVLVEELTIRAPLDAAFPTGIPAQTAGEMRPVPFFSLFIPGCLLDDVWAKNVPGLFTLSTLIHGDEKKRLQARVSRSLL